MTPEDLDKTWLDIYNAMAVSQGHHIHFAIILLFFHLSFLHYTYTMVDHVAVKRVARKNADITYLMYIPYTYIHLHVYIYIYTKVLHHHKFITIDGCGRVFNRNLQEKCLPWELSIDVFIGALAYISAFCASVILKLFILQLFPIKQIKIHK